MGVVKQRSSLSLTAFNPLQEELASLGSFLTNATLGLRELKIKSQEAISVVAVK